MNTPKLRYAHEFRQIPDLLGAVQALEPTAIIGVSTIAKSFDQRVVETMARLNERVPDRLRALEPDVEIGVHGGGGVRLVEGQGDLRQRQPLPAIQLRRQND